MALRIYGDPRSGNCLKVKWTAQFLDIPYEWIDVDVMTGVTRTPEFLGINPAGQVPTVKAWVADYPAVKAWVARVEDALGIA